MHAGSMLLWLVLFALSTGKAEPQNNQYAEKKQAQAKYRGAQVLRVKISTSAIKDLISKLQEEKAIEIWKRALNKDKFTDILVPASSPTVKEQLEKSNASVRIMISNVELAMKEENPILSQKLSSGSSSKTGHSFTFLRYHRLSDIYGYLEYLARTFPTICAVQNIGNTTQGRPVKALNIFGNDAKFSFVIQGGIHAREWITPASVLYILRELVEYRSKNSFTENFDFYVVPVANPDGYEYSHSKERLWRKNRSNSKNDCPGVDLNRNYGYKWGGLGASRSSCDETFTGPRSFSEPESQCMRDYVSNISKSVKAFITFHSYGQVILYPFGYNKVLAPDSSNLRKVGRRVAKNIKSAGGPTYKVGNSAILMYPASGGSDDWARGSLGIKYSYTIELRDGGRYGFLLPANKIMPTGKDAFIAIKTIATEIIANEKKKMKI